MRLGIITGPCLATTHGTGAQILRFFEGSGVPFFHIYWNSKTFGLSERSPSFLLEDMEWPWYRGRRFVSRIQSSFGFGWWKEETIREQKLRRLMRSQDLRCDVAYVVVARESEAQRANSLLRILNCPYVVHLMDLDHEEGLDPDTMMHYSQLLCGATSVLVLNDGLKQEVEKFGVADLQRVTFGQEVTPFMTQWKTDGQPIRLLIAGNVETHQEGLEMLSRALSQAPGRHGIEVIYTGANFRALPDALARGVTNRGYVSDDEYRKILSTCQLAYLPGPNRLNTIGRFSVPSRLSDYLMNGLPVIACLAAGSATEATLASLIPDAVRIARTPEQILQAVTDFTASAEGWQEASQRARDFAVNHMAVSTVRASVFKALNNAAQGDNTDLPRDRRRDLTLNVL